MANTSSAKKANRVAERRNKINQARRTRVNLQFFNGQAALLVP